MDTSTAITARDTLGRRISPRRFYPVQEKKRILAEATAPGASLSGVARRHGINANLVFAWRRQHEQGVLGLATRKSDGELIPVEVRSEPEEQRAEAGRQGWPESTLIATDTCRSQPSNGSARSSDGVWVAIIAVNTKILMKRNVFFMFVLTFSTCAERGLVRYVDVLTSAGSVQSKHHTASEAKAGSR